MFFLIASASRDLFLTENWPNKREKKSQCVIFVYMGIVVTINILMCLCFCEMGLHIARYRR